MTNVSLTVEHKVVNENRRYGSVRRLELLDALHESNRSGKLVIFVETVARLAGSKWTRLSYQQLMDGAGVARGTVWRWGKECLALDLIERRECTGGHEYRIAARFHRSRKVA